MAFVLHEGVPEFRVGRFSPEAGIYTQVFRFDMGALLADLREIEPLAAVLSEGFKVSFKSLPSLYGRCHTATRRIELSPKTIVNPANLLHTTIHEMCHLDKRARPRVGGRTPWHGPEFYKLLARSLDALYSAKIEETTMFSATYAVRKWKMYEFDTYAKQHPREERLADLYITEEARQGARIADVLSGGASAGKSFR